MTQNSHKPKRMAGRYTPAFTWHADIDTFLREQIRETPLLHVCSGPISPLGAVRVDRYVQAIQPAVLADWCALPFVSDSFAAVFADPPWFASYMKQSADFCKEALRVAPVAYVMSPWLWCSREASRTNIWVREFPGINQPILFVRYERRVKP